MTAARTTPTLRPVFKKRRLSPKVGRGTMIRETSTLRMMQQQRPSFRIRSSSNNNINSNKMTVTDLLQHKISLLEKEQSDMMRSLLCELTTDNDCAIPDFVTVHELVRSFRSAMTSTKRDHRSQLQQLKQELRQSQEAAHLKAKENERLRQQIESLEQELQEAKQIRHVHHQLSHGNEATDHVSVGDSSYMSSGLISIREKLKKRRESETKYMLTQRRCSVESVESVNGVIASEVASEVASEAASEATPVSPINSNSNTRKNQVSLSSHLESKKLPQRTLLSTPQATEATMMGDTESDSWTTVEDQDSEHSECSSHDHDQEHRLLLQLASYKASTDSDDSMHRILDMPDDLPEPLLQGMDDQYDDSEGDYVSSHYSPIHSPTASPHRTMPEFDLQNHSMPVVAPRSSSKSSSRSVSFSEVQVRLYSQTLGDNPSVTFGPPITLDWNFVQVPSIELDRYETVRQDYRAPTSRQLFLSSLSRRMILRNKGFTTEQMDAAIRQVEECRSSDVSSQRKRTSTSALVGIPASVVRRLVPPT